MSKLRESLTLISKNIGFLYTKQARHVTRVSGHSPTLPIKNGTTTVVQAQEKHNHPTRDERKKQWPETLGR